MGPELHTMYSELVEKLEYQNREAAEHDVAIKNRIWNLQANITLGLDGNRSVLKDILKVQKVIVLLQVLTLGVNNDTLSMLLKLL